MKPAVCFMLSLLCLEVALSTSAHIFEPDSRLLDSEQENKKEPFALACNKHKLEKPETRFGFFACLTAVRDVTSVAWKGWSLYSERTEVRNKAAAGRQKCQETSDTPEDLEECLKAVEEEYKKLQNEVNAKIANLMPEIRKAFWELLECFA